VIGAEVQVPVFADGKHLFSARPWGILHVGLTLTVTSPDSSPPDFYALQYGRIVERWVKSIGLDPTAYGTHKMRRTKATLIYKRTKNLRAVQLLLGHTKLESTVRYLGIEVDDALKISEQTEV